jgi:hypothetical protein
VRIWDINPGYLNRASLLGEHRELHGMVSIFKNNKKGYSRHPETLRWVGYSWALKQRHRLLAAEMHLRGYQDKSPVSLRANPGQWPDAYIDVPSVQFELIRNKYIDKEPGRIALPKNAQHLWSQHKYSVMARDNALYKTLGKRVAGMSPRTHYAELADELTALLRQAPPVGGIQNALLHMWGHVADFYQGDKSNIENWPLKKLLATVQTLAIEQDEPYLKSSTALGELGAWL